MSGESAVKTTPKDWHSSKQIGKRARYLLEHPDEEIPSDVTFLVGDGQNEPQKMFKCHKFILAMMSSMFQAMFYGSFPETESIIKVPDVTPAAFQHMLRYAYGDKVSLDHKTPEDALDTLYCAKKYLIDKLARTCRDHISFQVVVLRKDPFVVFQRGPQMDEEDLASLALSRIALHTPIVMKFDSLLRLSFACLKQIVEYPRLCGRESYIYQSVRRWVDHNVGTVTGSALRDAFGSLLHSIRFPLFSATELADGPVKDGILTSDESSSVFQFLFAQIKPELAFPTAPRIPLEEPLIGYFDLMTSTPSSGRLARLVRTGLILFARPDLAPACCAYVRRLVDEKLHIRIAAHDNEHRGKVVPLPAAVSAERSALSHSIQGACWFEWDMAGETTRNVRIGVGRKPAMCHSAVFGFIVGPGGGGTPVAFNAWNDQRIQSVTNFRW